jgi:DNA-binding transcriptional ArsR family regulator
VDSEVAIQADEEQLSRVFAALADPTRRAILQRLAAGEATVGELASPFPISLPAVSRHLKVLEAAGLISRGRSAQWRSSRLEPEPLREAMTWIERYRIFWTGRLDQLDAHLQQMAQRDAGAAVHDAADRDPDDDVADPQPRQKRTHLTDYEPHAVRKAGSTRGRTR